MVPDSAEVPADFFGPCLATQSKRPIICKMNELSKARATLLEVGEESVDQRIDNFLIRRLKGVPKSHVYRILRSGEVRVNSGRIKQDYKLKAGDKVRVPPVRIAAPENRPAPRPLHLPRRRRQDPADAMGRRAVARVRHRIHRRRRMHRPDRHRHRHPVPARPRPRRAHLARRPRHRHPARRHRSPRHHHRPRPRARPPRG